MFDVSAKAEHAGQTPCELARGIYTCTGKTACAHGDGRDTSCGASKQHAESAPDAVNQNVTQCEGALNLGGKSCDSGGWCCKSGTVACSGTESAATYACKGNVSCEPKEQGPSSRCKYNEEVEAASSGAAEDKLIARCQAEHGSAYACYQGSLKCK